MIYFLWAGGVFFIGVFYHFSLNDDLFKKNFLRKILFFTVYLLVVLFVGLRYETGGADWVSYKSFYEYIDPLNLLFINPESFFLNFHNHGFEPLFKLLASFIKVLTNNYITLQFFSCVFCFFCLFRFFNKVSPYLFFSIYIYICSFALLADMTVTRQMLAVSIFVLSLEYVVDRKAFKFLIFSIIASLFHYSAVIVVMYYFLYPYLSKRSILIFFVVCLLFLYFVFGGMTSFLIMLIQKYIHLNFALTLKLHQYDAELAKANFSLGFGFFERTFVFLISLFYLERIKLKFPRYGSLIISLFMFNYLLSLFFMDFSAFYMRFRYYFVFSNALLYTMFLCFIKEKIFGCISIFIYGLIWIYIVVYGNEALYLPYQNIISVDLGYNPVPRKQMIERFYEQDR